MIWALAFRANEKCKVNPQSTTWNFKTMMCLKLRWILSKEKNLLFEGPLHAFILEPDLKKKNHRPMCSFELGRYAVKVLYRFEAQLWLNNHSLKQWNTASNHISLPYLQLTLLWDVEYHCNLIYRGCKWSF